MESDFSDYTRSIVPGVEWPSLSDEHGAQMLGLQYQLERSQWLSPSAIEKHQLRQLHVLLSHAFETVPYYRDSETAMQWRQCETLTTEQWQSLPIIRRADVQAAGQQLLSDQPPEEHGPVFQLQTSGSTGMPITAWGTSVTQFFFHVLTLRQLLWQGRDFGAKLASIRPEVEATPGTGVSSTGWGHATEMALTTGESHVLSSRTDVGEQANWLARIDPVYLVTTPTNFTELAKYCKSNGIELKNLREVGTYGEVVSSKLRKLSREVFGVPLRDTYSAREIGYIAIECPVQNHYHVQSEFLRLEVLDEKGRPVSPGGIGRVILTPLHNFAMPLIRYEIGDYAELGEPCSCGRGLPVLKRIMGRSRNMLVRPDGQRHWPSFPEELWTEVAPVKQFQLIQTELHRIDVNIVTGRDLNAAEEQQLRSRLQNRFGYPFEIIFHYLDHIERTPGQKYEEFMSELPQPLGSSE